jgi:hypothetical protein
MVCKVVICDIEAGNPTNTFSERPNSVRRVANDAENLDIFIFFSFSDLRHLKEFAFTADLKMRFTCRGNTCHLRH